MNNIPYPAIPPGWLWVKRVEVSFALALSSAILSEMTDVCDRSFPWFFSCKHLVFLHSGGWQTILYRLCAQTVEIRDAARPTDHSFHTILGVSPLRNGFTPNMVWRFNNRFIRFSPVFIIINDVAFLCHFGGKAILQSMGEREIIGETVVIHKRIRSRSKTDHKPISQQLIFPCELQQLLSVLP